MQSSLMGKVLFFSLIGWGVLYGGRAYALQDGMRMGSPVFSGSGCPTSKTRFHYLEGRKSILVEFDAFRVNTSYKAEKTCNIAIPVHVPRGYTLKVGGWELSGARELPKYGTSMVLAGLYVAGQRQSVLNRSFYGSHENEAFVLKDVMQPESSTEKSIEKPSGSPCGKPAMIVASVQMRAKADGPENKAMSDIRSLQMGQDFTLVSCR